MLPLDKPEEVRVGIADWKVARAPQLIVTLGLGSCVGIAIWDARLKVGGLAHIMLPDSQQFSNSQQNPAKFADLALPMLWEEMQRQGARKEHVRVKLAGGAHMFNFPGSSASSLNVGERNVAEVHRVLRRLGLKVVAEDTGGSRGRTMILDTLSGEVRIRTVGQPVRLL